MNPHEPHALTKIHNAQNDLLVTASVLTDFTTDFLSPKWYILPCFCLICYAVSIMTLHFSVQDIVIDYNIMPDSRTSIVYEKIT